MRQILRAFLATMLLGGLTAPASAQFEGIWVDDLQYCKNGNPHDMWWTVGTFTHKKGVNYSREENARDVIWGKGDFYLLSNTTIGCSLKKIKRSSSEVSGRAQCDWDGRAKLGQMRLKLISPNELVISFDNKTVDFDGSRLFRCDSSKIQKSSLENALPAVAMFVGLEPFKEKL